MAQPVWVLSVDLQTKTATFQSGMADAAKSARTSFSDIKSGAGEMAGHVSTNMFASRHAIMAVSEAFGDTMPRAISALLVHIGPLGAALEAAFPYAAIGLAVVLILEHFKKMREAGIQLTEDQLKFKTAAENAFNSLEQKLLQAGIRADELRNDHLGALHLQLELINRQSMNELVQQFGVLAKAADVVMKELSSHWYTFGIGSDGAKHALSQFQTEYENLLAQGKDKEASDLLRGTRESAEHVLALQKQANDSHFNLNNGKGNKSDNQTAYYSAINELKKSGVGYTENEVKAQQQLVDALQDQTHIEAQVSELKKRDGDNAKTGTAVEAAARQSAAAKQAAESRLRISEASLAADRANSASQLEITRASITERMNAEIAFADRELQIKLKANADETAALDKYAKDYPNQLKAMHEKAEELEAQHAAQVSEIKSKAAVTQATQDLRDTEAGIRGAIDATQEGSAARLAVISAAINTERSLNMQGLQSFRGLLNERTRTVTKMAEEERRQRAEAGKAEAEDELRAGLLRLAAQQQQWALSNSFRIVTTQMRVQQETDTANQEYALKLAAMQKETSALDSTGRDYNNRLKALQDQQKQLTQQHENEITAIKSKAEMDRNQKILSAEQRYASEVSASLTQVLMGHKSFASAMQSLGDQVVSGLMQQAITHIEMNLMTKQSDGAAAARMAYLAGLKFPFPANIVMGPVLAAGAYAGVMAFNEGTDRVPGVGKGDVVPAMLTPGEGVVPGGVMDKLSKMPDLGGGNHYHAHVSPTYNLQALDATGVQKMLNKHAPVLQKHVENTFRKLNK